MNATICESDLVQGRSRVRSSPDQHLNQTKRVLIGRFKSPAMDRCLLPVTLSCFGQSFFSFPEPCNNWESLQAAHLRRDGGRKDNPPALMRLPTSTGRGATRPTRAGKSRSWRPSDEALHHAVTGDRFRELGCNLRTLPFTGGSIAGSRLLVRESKLQSEQDETCRRSERDWRRWKMGTGC